MKTILLVVIALASLLPALPANAQSKARWTAYAYDQTTGPGGWAGDSPTVRARWTWP